jgi:GNAT superfamily N-acetyltransferase
MKFREIEKADIQDILNIRVSTKENHFSMEDLATVGMTPQSVSEWLDGSIKGWVCEISNKLVGFAMGDSATGEIMGIAVYPDYEKQGIGKKLMTRLQNWLWTFDHKELWLWSNPSSKVRAHGFYRRLGWQPTGEIKGNNEILKLNNSCQIT